MNALIIGLGSMGKRRIRILRKYFSEIEVIGVDFSKERCMFCRDIYGIEAHETMEKVIQEKSIDCAFICTSPLSHAEIITRCLQNNIHVFSEINLTLDGYEENINWAKEQGKILFLSSTPLYRKEMEYIISKAKAAKQPFNYFYHVGQYLPDWHPWENFKEFFVGDKRTNGCREIFAIELPWMMQAFGEIEKIHVMAQRVSNLDVEFNDSYFVLIQHKNQNQGCFAVDVVCREPVRKLEMYGEDIFLEWQGVEGSLRDKDLKKNQLNVVRLYDDIDKLDDYSKTIIENPYIEEMKAFFSEIKGINKSRHCFETDIAVLKIIDMIETSCLK